MFILQAGRTEVVEQLLKMPGIEVNTHDKYGETPLTYAAEVSCNST